MTDWNFFATRLNGDGTETPLEWNLPLAGVQLIEDLSGAGMIEGTISPEIARLKHAGRPLFVPWSTAIYAERDGQIRGGAILVGLTEEGPKLGIDSVGFTGYATGQPYTGELSEVGADPLNMAREIWTHLQTKPRGNLGMVLDTTTSDRRIGVAATEENKDGPYQLAWWKTFDLGKEFDDLAKLTPFEYRTIHYWSGDEVRHRLALGYPTLGARRTDLRFVVGENIQEIPTIEYDGDLYADEVVVLGSGEGQKMIRSNVGAVTTDRLHRVAVVEDKAALDQTAANNRAREELAGRTGQAEITTFSVLNHPNAPLGSYSVGDEIMIQTTEGWTDQADWWVRILATTIDTDTDTVDVDVVPVGRAVG